MNNFSDQQAQEEEKSVISSKTGIRSRPTNLDIVDQQVGSTQEKQKNIKGIKFSADYIFHLPQQAKIIPTLIRRKLEIRISNHGKCCKFLAYMEE